MLLFLLSCSEPFSSEDTAAADTSADDTAADTDTAPIDTDRETGDIPDIPLELCINEVMPDNEASAADETGFFPDWIELHNPGAAAIDLEGWKITDYRLEPDRHTLGALTLEPGGFLVLWADELPETGPNHLGFKLGAEGGEVAVFAPDGRGSVLTYGPMAADFSLVRVPDCCEGDACLGYDFRGSPGESNVEPVFDDVPLLPAGSTWKYWDQGVNPGAGWQAAGFDDSLWPTGAGPLGYGDTHLVTTVGYGADAYAKHVTTWFRATFEGPPVALDALTLSVLRDDSAVVYLNGIEVARENLPEGDLTDATLALASIGSADETSYFDVVLDPAWVVEGTNTLAVEVHQSAPDSSDLGFDLAVTGQVEVTP